MNSSTKTQPARLEVWNDLHSERPVAYRLFWVSPTTPNIGSPAIGYCSPGGSYSTIKAAIADGERRFKETAVRVR